METGLEQERLQQEAELNQKINEEEVETGFLSKSFELAAWKTNLCLLTPI